ncbi:hypothetical protein predicted by Glimmer/Critica [Acetobacter senegalensis]|uniref:Uncharacterized protein n=1 Tax=Acetobacter senegalensis TaxID=446692 RepID=A0A0U5EWB0_9PROT|nr:hypothetical protein predicted by Glimmer/Critica [Acetobacter senegalensis]
MTAGQGLNPACLWERQAGSGLQILWLIHSVVV